jgi:hypothetical protein
MQSLRLNACTHVFGHPSSGTCDASNCYVEWHIAQQCCVGLFDAVQSAVQCGAVQSGVVLCCVVVRCGVVWRGVVQRKVAQGKVV